MLYYYYFYFTAPIRIFSVNEDYCCLECINGSALSLRLAKDKDSDYKYDIIYNWLGPIIIIYIFFIFFSLVAVFNNLSKKGD